LILAIPLGVRGRWHFFSSAVVKKVPVNSYSICEENSASSSFPVKNVSRCRPSRLQREGYHPLLAEGLDVISPRDKSSHCFIVQPGTFY